MFLKPFLAMLSTTASLTFWKSSGARATLPGIFGSTPPAGLTEKGSTGATRALPSFSDHRGNCTSHERVSAKNRVRAALLGPAVIYKDRRFAVIVNSRVNLRIRHRLDFDLFLPRPCLSKANCNHQSKNANRACKFAHRDLLDSPE